MALPDSSRPHQTSPVSEPRPTGSPAAMVRVHPSQLPARVNRVLAEGLRRGDLPSKLHYLSRRQARAWLELHLKYAPYATAADGAELYARLAASVAQSLPRNVVDVVSLGCGGGLKDRWVLESVAKHAPVYVPVDAGLELVLEATVVASGLVPPERCFPQLLDLQDEVHWNRVLSEVLRTDAVRIVLAYGLLPNFEPALLRSGLQELLRPGDLVLISANLVPEQPGAAAVKSVLPLYDNPETRAWLAMGLEDLGLDPREGDWQFRMVEDTVIEGLCRIETWFTPNQARLVPCGGQSVSVAAGQALRVFFSNRFTDSLVTAWIEASGLKVLERGISRARDEGVYLGTPA